MNDRGQVVGTSGNEDDDVRATLWDHGVAVDLGVPDGDSWATAINDAGQVAGWMFMPDGTQHAFLWEHGVLTDLGAGGRGGTGAGATAINSRGQVVGSWSGSGSPIGDRVCVWDNGSFTDLGPSRCYGMINDRGQVAWCGPNYHALLWDHGVTTDIGGLAGSVGTWPVALSNSGVVAANVYLPSGARPIVWERNHLQDLSPAATGSEAYAMNARGQVVGYIPVLGAYQAVLWEAPACGRADPPGSGRGSGCDSEVNVTTLSDSAAATDINDRGQVLVVDAINHSFLWEPGRRTDLPYTVGDTTLSWEPLQWQHLNNSGQVFGFAYTTSNLPVAWLWDQGHLIELSGLDGAPQAVSGHAVEP